MATEQTPERPDTTLSATSRRYFVAVPLPGEVQQELADWQNQLRDRMEPIRWTRPENLHITLRFLGSQAEDSLEKLGNSVLSVGRLNRAFDVCCHGIGAFPSLRKARVVWAGLSPDKRWALLYRQLTRQLEQCGIPADQRPFTPHLTLGRVRGRPLNLGLPPASLADITSRPFSVDKIVLYESRLGPGGALHLPRVTARLGNNDISCHTTH